MKIIIAGDGKVGLALTRLLSQEGHDLVTIDSNREIIERDMQQFDVISIAGNCASMETLKEANVQQADVLIAATSADEINLLCCLTARRLNPSLHTIARVRSPEYIEQLYMMREEFGLSLMINPEREAAKEIFRLLQLPGFLKRETFAKGRVEIVELRITEHSLLENVILNHLLHVLGCKVLVCAVVRDGKAFIPTGDTSANGEIVYKLTIPDGEEAEAEFKIADGSWIQQFDPYYPYFAYMYREANAWQSLFFAPHDPEGMIALYPSKEAVEQKLDSLFSEPWRGYEAHNMTGFMGNYCHGNQPDHSVPYTYYFIGKQEKAQCVIDSLLNHYYDMGKEHLAYAGMDDAGEMSAWYVFNALGLYTYSPADPEYIVTVPLFDRVAFTLGDSTTFTIRKQGQGRQIESIRYDGKPIDGWFISHDQLRQGKELVIQTN